MPRCSRKEKRMRIAFQEFGVQLEECEECALSRGRSQQDRDKIQGERSFETIERKNEEKFC